jgi:hypothetical protein
MSIPPIAKATLQAAVINAGSNVLAQGIKSNRDQLGSFSLKSTSLRGLRTFAPLRSEGEMGKEVQASPPVIQVLTGC